MNVLTYEQLKQQLEAMTGENARLKRCAICWAELYADEMGDPHIAEDALPKTPLTDAALAAVEAKAIEKAAKEIFGCGYSFELLMRYTVELREGRA